ncbi:transposase [Rhodoferax sp.]|uniref:transposase n=1 Tax=Rhodoferax sp. TaxID=50421 RepID=UPI0025E8D4C6|nr:transposase [Rhodoferax sp.]
MVYLAWLKEYAEKHQVEVLAYCLMTNHIHLIAVPATDDGLQQTLKPLHMRYAQRFNRQRDWTGHVWQGRFFSSPLDDVYLWAALRYVECNPVRAGMANRAEDYRWSSAPAHCGRCPDVLLKLDSVWHQQFAAVEDWSAWLAQTDDAEKLKTLRLHADKGLPCGDEHFVERLGAMAGRSLVSRSPGRPKAEKG